MFELEIRVDSAKYTSVSMKHESLKYTHCSMLVANTFWARGLENRSLKAIRRSCISSHTNMKEIENRRNI